MLLYYVFLLTFLINSDCVFVNFCLTPECQQTANNIINALNKSTTPCNDFYEFACGGFNNKATLKQPIWNHWQSISEQIHIKLTALMDVQEVSLKKAQQVFKACLTMENQEDVNVKHLKDLIDTLMGGWPLVLQENWKAKGFDWGETVVNVIKTVGVYPLLKIFPEVDYNDTTRKTIYIQLGEVNLPQAVFTNRIVKPLNFYKKWIHDSIKSLFASEIKQQQKSVISDIKSLVDFETSLAKLYMNHDNKNKRMSIKKLSQITRMNWLQMLTQLFSGTNTSFYDHQNVVITSFATIKKLILLLNSTKSSTIADYLTWTVVKTFSRDTTKHLRNLNFLINKIFFDLKVDVNPMEECVQYVKSNFGFALIRNYVQFYIEPHTLATVSEMVHKIKSEFVGMLKENRWLTMQAKNVAVEKITNLDCLIGYPKWTENTTEVDLYYKELKIVDNHFVNVLMMRQFQMRKELLQIGGNYSEQWPVNPFEVNAFYSVLKNAIVIPIGVMEAPFFDANRPEIFNYGSLGSLIGHEISHALDTTGRKFNEKGELTNWWPSTDVLEYEKRTKCYESQYSNYKIDGFATLGENIADSVGLTISYRAFKSTKASNFPVVIPQLGFYTNEQLFFISFAQLWCEISNAGEFLNETEHSPVKYRVIGTVANSQINFNRAFQCANLNKNRCTLW